MGFFSKIFKGVKKVFKKIGKGIKGVFKGIGKFMNKIGIVGQIALMFIPGIGPMLNGLLKGLGGMAANVLTTYGGAIGQSIVSGAKFVINKASAFAGSVKNTFRTVTQGVKNFASEFTKTGLNKMGFDPVKFGFKEGGSFNQWVQSGADQTFGDAWNKVTTNISENASKILDPFKKSIEAGSNTTLESLSDSAYKSMDEIKAMNPQITDWDNIGGQTINLDPDFIPNQVTTKEQYDQFWKTAGSNLESQAVSNLPSSQAESLLSKYADSPISGAMTEQSATDFQKVLEDLTPKVTDTVAPPAAEGGLFGVPSVERAVGTAGQELIKQGVTQLMTPEMPEYSQGYMVDVGHVPVYGATPQQNFAQVAYEPYAQQRDPYGSFGYGNGANNTWGQWSQLLGVT